MIETLEKILTRYQHLSDYAETKLGVLIAFNSALIFGLCSMISGQEYWLQIVIFVAVSFNCISLFFAFSGVFAKTNNKHSSSKNSETKNYYYYKYVASLNESQFLNELAKDYNLKSENRVIEGDLGNQIVVLANNANRKYFLFNIGLNFTIASLISPVGLLIFHIYNNPN